MKASALLVVLFAGCANLGGSVEESRRSWQGASYEDVVLRWGTPVRDTALPDGRQVYTWESTGSSMFPGSISVFGGSGGAGVGAIFGLPGMGGGPPQRCKRTFVFKDGRVVDQSWLGPPGFCSTFRRD